MAEDPLLAPVSTFAAAYSLDRLEGTTRTAAAWQLSRAPANCRFRSQLLVSSPPGSRAGEGLQLSRSTSVHELAQGSQRGLGAAALLAAQRQAQDVLRGDVLQGSLGPGRYVHGEG